MSTLQGMFEVGSRALFAAQNALNVTGHNIANANTEGYSRRRVNFATSEPIVDKWGEIGTGVKISTIDRYRDEFLDGQIRTENASFGYWQKKEQIYAQLETAFREPLLPITSSSADEPTESGLHGALLRFWDSWQKVASDPTSDDMRAELRSQAQILTDTFNSVDRQLNDIETDLNSDLEILVEEINDLLSQIRNLNQSIGDVELNKNAKASDMRDERDLLLNRLSEIVSITVYEDNVGRVKVVSSGVNLVNGVEKRELTYKKDAFDSLGRVDLYWHGSENDVPVGNIKTGELGALLDSRDNTVAQIREQFDILAKSVIEEINKIHCGAAGKLGYTEITAQNRVNIPTASLSAVNLPFNFKDGSFTIQLLDTTKKQGNQYVSDYKINVTANMTLEELAEAIDASDGTIDGGELQTEITEDGYLRIIADKDRSFIFHSDNSNLLSALGINVFFAGDRAANMRVGSQILDPALGTSRIAVADPNETPGRQIGPENATAALAIARLKDVPVLRNNTVTINSYERGIIATIGVLTRESTQLKSTSEGMLSYLGNQWEAVSGVSLDEEMTNLLKYQHAYTAAARYINVIDEMMDRIVSGLGTGGR